MHDDRQLIALLDALLDRLVEPDPTAPTDPGPTSVIRTLFEQGALSQEQVEEASACVGRLQELLEDTVCQAADRVDWSTLIGAAPAAGPTRMYSVDGKTVDAEPQTHPSPVLGDETLTYELPGGMSGSNPSPNPLPWADPSPSPLPLQGRGLRKNSPPLPATEAVEKGLDLQIPIHRHTAGDGSVSPEMSFNDGRDAPPLKGEGSGERSPSREARTSFSTASTGRGAGGWGSGSQKPAAAENWLGEPGNTRYQIRELLARDPVDEVVLAWDRDIGRLIAIKRPVGSPTGEARATLLREARLIGQLEHPNIVPVHEAAVGRDGGYYAMRYVAGRSLEEIVTALRQGLPDAAEFTQYRLLQIFAQVCQALHFAHVSGVVHTDLTPAHIKVGEFGEVFVMGWSRASTPPLPIDPRMDIFLLGAILYELLTWHSPLEGATPAQRLDGATPGERLEAAHPRRFQSPRERAPERDISPLLEEIVLRALAIDPGELHARAVDPDNLPAGAIDPDDLRALAADPNDRYSSALALYQDIEAFLDGSRERAFRRQQAARLVEEANALTLEYARLLSALGEALHRVERHGHALRGWEPIEEKRPLWEAEDRAAALEEQLSHLFSDLEGRYQGALSLDEDCTGARDGLAGLHWEKFLWAEQLGRAADQVYHRRKVEQLESPRYATLLKGAGWLEVASDPPGAEVLLYRYEEVDRVLVPVQGQRLGVTPLPPVELGIGAHLVVLRRAGYRPTRCPVLVERNATSSLDVPLYRDADIGDCFLYVPGGVCRVGGDTEAFDSLPRQQVEVPGFFIARFPVTFGEYLEFINDLEARDPAEAMQRVPRDRVDGMLCSRSPDGVWTPTWELLFKEGLRERYPREAGREGRLPVSSISWFDAMVFVAWRSARDGLEYRLPTELEWEKAARGVDGRPYPWGHHFDPAFCKMQESRPGEAGSEPVGTFKRDVSPYRVRDLAGGMREWTASVYDRAEGVPPAAASVPEDAPRVVRGGCWYGTRQITRCAYRFGFSPLLRDVCVGFRLVRSAG